MTFNLEELSDTVKLVDMNLRNTFFPGGVFCNLNESDYLHRDCFRSTVLTVIYSSLQSQEKLGSVHTCLRLMRDLHATLGSVFTTVRKKAPRVERHHNLVTLPDEILSYIVKNACGDAWETGDWRLERKKMDRLVANLSLVSRRFRNAVVNTASLWTCVDNRYCLATGFDERIERSKHLPLTLLIDFRNSDGKRQNILSRIMSIKDRCQRFRARVDAKAAKEVPAAEFAAVESLELSFSFPCSRNDWSRVFNMWTFTNVTSLRINDAIPPPGVFPNVTICTLSYDPGSLGVNNFSYERLLQMFASIPQLRHLTVKFHGHDIPSPIDLVPVTLPSLSTITLSDDLDVSLSRAPPRLGRILASLILPNVKDTHLHVQFATAGKLLSWVDSISPDSERLREVTSLTIESHTPFSASHLTRDIMHALFTLFRNIRRLELQAYQVLETLRDLGQNLELNQLCVCIPRKPDGTKPVHIERKDLDKLTRFPDDVHIA